MDYVYWGLIILLFIIAFVGLIYPVIPSVLFIFAGFILYGFLFSFEPFSWIYWIIQGLFVILLSVADYVSNLVGVKKFGGSKAGVWGSTIGLLVGPFIIPFLGILLRSVYWRFSSRTHRSSKKYKGSIKNRFWICNWFY